MVVRLSVCRDAGSCPACGRASTRVHDRYERRLQDLPPAGHAVRILLLVRRFVCADSACPQRTFAQQIPGLTSPLGPCHGPAPRIAGPDRARVGQPCRGAHGQRSGPYGGADGAVEPDSGHARPALRHPQALGVDDFATRRGHSYATVITDGERHRPIDVLPGHEAAPLAARLTAHPGWR
ncbi:transposase family protein [Streptomyces sp. NPDC087263]|uniref:transposase family protein n=1 Tax=Streptomyces sp. NPDC087263 TaxID=3365773 RepID=UPI00380275FB